MSIDLISFTGPFEDLRRPCGFNVGMCFCIGPESFWGCFVPKPKTKAHLSSLGSGFRGNPIQAIACNPLPG